MRPVFLDGLSIALRGVSISPPPEMSDKYALRNSEYGGDILLGGVFESLPGYLVMNP